LSAAEIEDDIRAGRDGLPQHDVVPVGVIRAGLENTAAPQSRGR
jgi:hypothetical protein